MIANIEIYVIGKGYTHPDNLNIGDEVYVLDDGVIKITKISNVESEQFSGNINVIKSGQHQAKVTDETKHLYKSEFDYKYTTWEQIPKITRDKYYFDKAYCPVLSGIDERQRSYTDLELDGLARQFRLELYKEQEMVETLRSLTGYDNYIFIDFLENWLSDHPGKGTGFDAKNVKTRMFYIGNDLIEKEIVRISCLSGFTAEINGSGYLRINFESTPIPGSVPKPQKYFKELFSGAVYRVNADNLPILGKSQNKYFFIPTGEFDNGD